MKKLSICFLMIMCLFMTGCGDEKVYEAATLDEFSTVATNNNFVVSSNMNDYVTVDYIIDAKKAVLNDIEIEMIEYSDSETAEKVLEGHVESFNLLKSTGAHEENNKGSNYHRYVLVSNNRYMITLRVDNMLIFSKTLITNQETINKFFEELGY